MGCSRKELIKALQRWFDANQRDLPWRSNRTAYTTLVAEAMLQQTQVSRVADRFTRFLNRFPSVHELADADEQQVLAEWQGLGYYRRARHLHAAARRIVDEHDGEVPRSVQSLKELPGVGRYTAGAIASMAFDEPASLVDGNVYRVLSRLWARDQPADNREAINWAWDTAQNLVESATKPGLFNEALMELGATVCTPRRPQCDQCPLAAHCRALQHGRVHEIPPAKQPVDRKHVHHHAVVVQRGDRVLVERRPSDGLWSNMWQVPTVEAGRALSQTELRGRLPVNMTRLEKLARFEHQTTHRRITFHVFEGRSRTRRGEWHHLDNLDDLPMSNPQRRILDMLRK